MRFYLLLSLVCLLMGQAWAQSARFLAEETTWNDVRRGVQQEVVIDGVYLDGMGSAQVMRMQPMKVWADDAVIRIQRPTGETVMAAPTHTYLRGYLEDRPLARVALVLTEAGEVRGLVAELGRFWLVEGAGHQLAANLASRELVAEDLGADDSFACGSERLPGTIAHQADSIVNEETHRIEFDPNRLGTPTYEATIAYETDEEFLALFGNTTDATDYIGDLTAYMSTMYSAETDTSMAVGSINFWDGVSDPWDEPGTACTLLEFGKYWNDNNGAVTRTTAHFLSGRSMGGGIAWVGVLCSGSFNTSPAGIGTSCNTFSGSSNYGGAYGVSANLVANFNINNPTSVWDIIVVSHEIGHNFNSPHTHCYNGLEGNASPVDECFSGENGCFAGTPSLPCAQSGQGCGTIMSYCHQLSPGLSNIGLTLGLGHPHGTAPERVPTRMNAHVINRHGSNPACLEPVQGCDPPSITLQPSPQSLCAGETLTLTVTATGTNLTYQWQQNGQNIPGATSATYTKMQTTVNDSGPYRCVIDSDCGSVNSSEVVVTVSTATVINQQSESQDVCVGDPVELSVSAVGTELSYQWRFNGSPITGATQATYNAITFAELSDAGTYDCVVSSATCDDVTSNAIVLGVVDSVAITQQPVGDDVCTGEEVSFSVVASGSNLTYQWRQNGQDIAGANSATYTIAAATANDAGTYTCFITSSCGEVTSSGAVLTVTQALVIIQGPTNLSRCEGEGFTFTVVADGVNVTYQWQKDGNPIAGATSSSYSKNEASLADAGSYTCVVNSDCGTTTTAAATLEVDVLPAIVDQPQSRNLCTGDTLTLAVNATGAVSFQWLKNGQQIQGATSTVFEIKAVQTSDAGSYTCNVTNSCGSVLSAAATVNVSADQASVVLDQSTYTQAGSPVTIGFTFEGCPLEDASWVWRDSQTQQVYGTDVQNLTLPLLAETTGIVLEVTAQGGNFNETLSLTVLVTNNTEFDDPNGDGCLNGDDVVFMSQFWLSGSGADADGNGAVNVLDFTYIDTSGECPGLPRTAKLGPTP